jgi:hypothetical protein
MRVIKITNFCKIRQNMSRIDNKFQIALLLPTVELGAYWLPVLEELTKLSEKAILYTGRPWSGFDSHTSSNAVIQVVGQTKRIKVTMEVA